MYARKLMCHCYRCFAEVIKKELNSSNTNVTTQAIPLTYLKLQNIHIFNFCVRVISL
jgi:hypothetical protein